ICSARGNGYTEVEDVWRRAGTPPHVLEILAEADAFAALGDNRREALWHAKAVKGAAPLPLFAQELDGEGLEEPPVTLPEMSSGENVVEDYVSMRLTLRAHPMALLRPLLTPDSGPAGKPQKQEGGR
ncbi:MAG: error-prone DNA polymerase, partial [Rhodobacteraceae bacterium]|nr:error-prone DNA polymerase [Paracoccaceae bacterium]